MKAELEKAHTFLRSGDPKQFDRHKLISGEEGVTAGPGSDRALAALLNALGAEVKTLVQPTEAPRDAIDLIGVPCTLHVRASEPRVEW